MQDEMVILPRLLLMAIFIIRTAFRIVEIRTETYYGKALSVYPIAKSLYMALIREIYGMWIHGNIGREMQWGIPDL